MFDSFLQEKHHMQNKTKYAKNLGWHEVDEEGDKIHAMIFVIDIDLGYAVFRQGTKSKEIIFYSFNREKAVEWAVDRARQEIADHEIQQVKKEVKDVS